MKKWIFYTAIILLGILVWQSWALYDDATGYQHKQIANVKERLDGNKKISEIQRITLYYGQHAYGVARVKSAGEDVIMFLPLESDEKQKKRTIPKQNYSQKQMKQSFINKHSNAQLISVKLGLFNDVPAWEITYINNQDQYVFEYYRYDSREYLNQIKIS